MENNKHELEFENQRLEQTISLAKSQLNEAILENENNKTEIKYLKQEVWDNETHSVSNLWNSQNFEDFIALNQSIQPVTRKILDFETVAQRITTLERIIKSPYFARIDFKFDDDNDFEKIYIGRSSLVKDDSYEMEIYDWRSPIASIFYRFQLGSAYYDAPLGRINGEVNLKRQYEIKNGKLEYFFDADVQIVDEFLRKMLSQNTSSKMKTIVETIQKEQDIVIRDMENELMMVQGVAGSGKTSIALHRAAYLMYQGLSSKLAANNIIIISPNTLFEQYISNVLPELGEDNVVSVVFEDILDVILGHKHIQSRNRFLEVIISNSPYGQIMKRCIEFKTSHEFLEILNRFIDDIPHKWMEFNNIYYDGERIISSEVLKNKIIEGREGTPLELKLKQLEDFIMESVKETHKNLGNKDEYFRIKSEIEKYSEINVEDLYRKLFNDEEYFYSLSKDLKLPDFIKEIVKFTQENLCSEILYYDDAIVLTFLTLKLKGSNEYKNIKQVVIDEAQDYYPLHFEIFNLLFKNAKYTILGDINQTLEKQEDLSLYDDISKILNKKKSTLVTMDKSFRCTNEILNFSSKFIPHTMEIKSFNRTGDEPEIITASNDESLCSILIKEAKFCIDSGYESVGLICKTEKNALTLYNNLKDKIDLEIVKNESSKDLHGIFIIPVYMSKGLEFDSVLICDANNENYKSEDDKKLLYIASTRALHRLNLFCSGEVSHLL